MNLSYLEAFCVVVKTGSISKAAQKLHISQPALSQQVRDLENYYQEILLNRTNRGVSPTEIGQLVYKYSQKMLNLAHNLEKEIEKHRNNAKQELTIGASTTIGGYALPCSIYILKERYPLHNIRLAINNSEGVVDKIIEGAVDFGMVEGPIKIDSLKSEGMEIQLIAKDELILIVPFTKEWEERQSVTLEELKSLPLILREKGSGIRKTFEETIKEHGINPDDLNTALELNDIAAIKSSVGADRGISMLPKMSIRKELRHRTLKSLEVEGVTFVHPLYIIYSPDKVKNSLARNFLQFIRSKDRGFC